MQYLIFLPTCIFVRGYMRSAIYDTQRVIIDFIPNDLYDFYIHNNKKSLDIIYTEYDNENLEIIKEYIDFLLINQYAIIGSEKDSIGIKDIDFDWKYPGIITNCVCEYSLLIKENLTNIINIVDEELGCTAFQFVSDNFLYITDLKEILNSFIDNKYISHLEIIIPYLPEYNIENIHKILTNFFYYK